MRKVPDTAFKDRGEFERTLDGAATKIGLKLPAPARKAILSALSERDETIGRSEADSKSADRSSLSRSSCAPRR